MKAAKLANVEGQIQQTSRVRGNGNVLGNASKGSQGSQKTAGDAPRKPRKRHFADLECCCGYTQKDDGSLWAGGGRLRTPAPSPVEGIQKAAQDFGDPCLPGSNLLSQSESVC